MYILHIINTLYFSYKNILTSLFMIFIVFSSPIFNFLAHIALDHIITIQGSHPNEYHLYKLYNPYIYQDYPAGFN